MAAVVFQRRPRVAEPFYPNRGPDIDYYYETYSQSARLQLPPMLWLHALAMLPPAQLAAVAVCCPLLAELAEDEDLWRRVCIRRLPPPRKEPLRYRRSWRTTALEEEEGAAGASCREASPASSSRAPVESPSRPLAGVGTSPLGLPALMPRRLAELGPAVPRHDVPLLLSGALESVLSDPAKWQLSALLEHHGEHKFRCVCQEPGGMRHRHVWMRLADYMNYCHRHQDLEPLYLFDAELPKELSDGVLAPAFIGRDYVGDIAGTEFLQEQRWIAVGAAGSGTRMHVDPAETSAWNLVVAGRKRWLLLPPSSQPPGMDWQEDGAMIAPGAALWFRAVGKDPKLQGALRSAGALEAEQGPGDLLFVPNGWWHTVVNLEPTVAYTENCVTAANLEAVASTLERLGDPASAARLRRSASAFAAASNKLASFHSELPAAQRANLL